MHVRFKAIGSVRQLDPPIVDFPDDTRFAAVVAYICRAVDVPTLWCYIANAFVPSPETSVAELAAVAAIAGTASDPLLVTYSLVEAFG